MSSKDNYVIFNPEGGLGKIIASTAVVRNIRAAYPDHKIIVVTPWPEVYLNNPNVERVYRSGNTPYFYKDYIKGRQSIVLKGEPYFNTGHLYNKQQLVKSWCKLHNYLYLTYIISYLYVPENPYMLMKKFYRSRHSSYSSEYLD